MFQQARIDLHVLLQPYQLAPCGMAWEEYYIQLMDMIHPWFPRFDHEEPVLLLTENKGESLERACTLKVLLHASHPFRTSKNSVRDRQSVVKVVCRHFRLRTTSPALGLVERKNA
jgi:hypothetical protein